MDSSLELLDKIDQDEAYRVLQNICYQSEERGGIDNSIRFSTETEELLMSHQNMHVFNMISALGDKKNNAILDGSYTGTGKTYTTAAICKETKRQPFIICLKSNISTWKKVLDIFGVESLGIVNYEMIRTGKYYQDGEVTECPYITREKTRFKWDFSEVGKRNIVMVFDEVHVCKNKSSLNSKLLTSCKSLKTIMLSATLCDKIEDFGVFGMMLGFYASVGAGKNWMQNILRREKRRLDKRKEDVAINLLHKKIFNIKGSRMSLDDLGDDMSRNQISIECYTVDKKVQGKIDKLYEEVRKQKRKAADMEDMDTELARDKKATALKAITFKREKIENAKSEILMELAESYLGSRMSVVIFVNYRSTHQMICDKLRKLGIDLVRIHGDQTGLERDEQIEMFQRNEVRIMVAMAQAGGSSISLHDTTGKFPRASIISPSYSVIELVQILGRIRRSGTKSPTIQKIVYCANTCEEHIAEKVREKEEIMSLMTGEKSIQVLRVEKHEKDGNTGYGDDDDRRERKKMIKTEEITIESLRPKPKPKRDDTETDNRAPRRRIRARVTRRQIL
jgi:Mimiviridae putative ATP-dependent RNA helicase